MSEKQYRILLKKEPEGGYTAIVPALPGCITWGRDVDHSKQMAREAIELYIESLEAHNEPVPDDSDTLEYSVTV